MSALSAESTERFRHELNRLGVTRSAEPVLAAVSGGADSLALLLLLHNELGSLCRAATVDHGLRDESAKEAEYVAAVCRARTIPHTILSGQFPARSGRTLNLSARARDLRYSLLERHRLETACGWIATAHHADDQVETMIMRLNRGAGVGGLAGIRERQGRVVRPLIEWRRSTLASIVRAEGLQPIDDPTNQDERYDRARLRRALSDVDWLDVERMAYSAHNLAAADEALEWAAADLFERRCDVGGRSVRYRRIIIPNELHRRLVKRCVLQVDPTADCSKGVLARAMIALLNGDKTMVGNVLCSVGHEMVEGNPAVIWTFAEAPPRRSNG